MYTRIKGNSWKGKRDVMPCPGLEEGEATSSSCDVERGGSVHGESDIAVAVHL